MKLLALNLSILLGVSAFAQSNYQLNLHKDSSYHQYSKTEMDMTQMYGGQIVDSKILLEGTIEYTVESVENDLYTMRVEYQRVHMFISYPGAEIKGSSDDDDDSNIFSAMFSGIVGVPFHLKMDRHGSISDIWGTEKMWEQAIKGIEDVPKATKDQLVEQISSSFGGDKLKENLELLTALYPRKPVSVGESWKVKTKRGGSDALSSKSVYTLSEANDEFSKISGISKLKVSSANQSGQNEKNTFTGVSTSSLTLDAKTGWILHGSIIQNIEGDLKMPLYEGSNKMTTIPSYIRTSISVSETPFE